ncbi:cholest-4-en-3-one 26-monooxygenase [Thermomonospora echinospora]|uniref:Cholest-4-en-3-one 26-monooxygenase n=1 Tax=Thermomonospora echinospora TaxID=1992 RepID=A0A1H5V5K3_9ACTN|nr:cytochrome P450 [Thermomonospora echinospora]SEF81727.1 cholest-4-en-3-one 26-monooxygenase [Thermomonospora echinospora]
MRPQIDVRPDIDIIDPGVYERGGIPHEQFRWIRDNDPVFWHHDLNEGVPGFWAVTRHADVVHVSRNPELFSSHVRSSLYEEFSEDDLALFGLMMLFQDPPDHTRNRLKVNRGFTPRMIKQLEGHIRDICNELIDRVSPLGQADFAEDIAAPLPAYIICELLGAPQEDREQICDWSNKIIGFSDPEMAGAKEEAAALSAELMAYASELAAQRRAEPRDDIATKLLQPDEHGNVLSDEEFQLFVLMLVIAGHETTRTGSVNGIQAFFDHPEQWERLKADRSLLRTAPDEIVRWTSPLNLFRRTATRDTELGGKQIKKGDKVVMFYGSANRDERVIEDPFTFDIGRDPNPHVGFGGGGPHFCLGTHLARLELAVLFETILDRMPDIRPAGPPRRLRSNFVNGIKELRVEFTPSPSRSV